MSDTEPICIIPARGVSPGLPKKNLKRIAGKHMFVYSIDAAKSSSHIENIYVSTESNKIATIAEQFESTVTIERPEKLSQKESVLRDVVLHAVDEIKQEIKGHTVTEETPIIILQPNVPFRRSSDIDRAIEKSTKSENKVIISAVREKKFYWRESHNDKTLSPLFDERQVLREEIEPIYRETGSITVTTPTKLRDGVWTGETPAYIITDKLSGFEVNTLVDFWIAEQIVEGPTVVFRVDGGDELGLGKVYRCLTIATELQSLLDCNIEFISNESYNGGIKLIENKGFNLQEITSTEDSTQKISDCNPDIIFFDVGKENSENLDILHEESAAVINLESFEQEIKNVDYTLNPQRKIKQINMHNHLSGPKYLVVREEFLNQSPYTKKNATNVLITFGGSDPLDLTTQVMTELGERGLSLHYKIVLGPDYNDDNLSSIPGDILSKFDIRKDVSNMGKLMNWADIAISSGGRTVYELAATGTPTIVIAQNNGEVERMEILREQGVIEFFGHGKNSNIEHISEAISTLAKDYEQRRLMSERGQEVVDGDGLTRILNLIQEILIG